MRTKFMSLNRTLLVTMAVVPAVAFVGCGGGSESENGMDSAPMEPMESSAPASDPASSSGGSPRVFFVAPGDGGEFSSDFDLEMEFGAENYEISPIPEGFDAETDTPRSDVGHFHVGIDAGGCLPVGQVIPQGEGWVHFGDGSNTFTMQSEPAEYELTLQIGDDAHRTQEDLCETISVTIADGI
ncbi:MAG TPA: DUF4399 domain-containing protein [Acidobacteria bacterium]|nr:DUF4399 domain-containing protein [Acidobacteriota bacterium]